MVCNRIFFHAIRRAVFCSGAVSVSFAAAHAADQSTASARVSINASEGTSTIKISLHADDGLKFNFDGPWKLEIRGLETQRGDPGVYTTADIDRSNTEFTVPLKSPFTRQTPDGEYRLTYFLCDAAETWCKRLQTEGKVSVTQAKSPQSEPAASPAQN